MDDDICPRCGNCSVWQRGKRSSEDDYECGSCNLAYSISGSDWPGASHVSPVSGAGMLTPARGGGGVRKGPKRGYRDNYECRGCGIAFSVSGSDWPIRVGNSAHLKPDASGWLRLRPDSL
jgi:hypothetical protein